MLNLTITEGKLGEFPAVTKPHPGFFYEVGEERFRELVNAHYDLIRESDIAFLFPVDDEDFAEAQKHAADFLIQICGGPNYFEQTRGEARLVGRHAPFRIDEAGRHTWLELYTRLLPCTPGRGHYRSVYSVILGLPRCPLKMDGEYAKPINKSSSFWIE